jgi:hypothetical protein
MKITNTHRVAIITKYIPMTEHKSARVKASAGSGRDITVSWHDNAQGVFGAHAAAAIALCQKMGWTSNDMTAGGTETDFAFNFIPQADAETYESKEG